MDISLDELFDHASSCDVSGTQADVDPLISQFGNSEQPIARFNGTDCPNSSSLVEELWAAPLPEKQSTIQLESILTGLEDLQEVDWTIAMPDNDHPERTTGDDFGSFHFDEPRNQLLSPSASSCNGDDDFLSDLIAGDALSTGCSPEQIMQENQHPILNDSNLCNIKMGNQSSVSSPCSKSAVKVASDDVMKTPPAKSRDKSTQRKLRNKESARRYREKQVAKRRQLEDFTRSLAEQNRELESLHEKLLALTCGQTGAAEKSNGLCNPLQDINQ